MARVIKSLVYLASFTTIGYVLMKLTEPTPEKLREIHGTKYKDPEVRKRNELILNKLREAAERKDPVYLQKSTESTNQSSPQQPTKREII
jgi:hypothetical protein